MSKDLPYEGVLKPCDLIIYLDRMEKGDTYNIHAPCTLTVKSHTDYSIIFEVSDLLHNEPEDV